MAPPRTGIFSTSVGTKILIGLSGLGLVIYLIIHIVGNLLILLGPDVFNRYAYAMEERNPALPAIEIALLAVFLLHIYKTVTMFVGNQSARPVRYVQKKNAGRPSRKSLASSTMIVTGLWLLAFLLVHVKTFRFTPSAEWPAGGRDLYQLEVSTFANPLVVVFYILSMIVVGSHLWHGVSSGFQSLGVDHPKVTPTLLVAGKILAVLIAGGFIMIAAWVYLTQGGRVRV
jgi:succinate dehydrogenase cytochrome b subunit